MIYLTLRQKEYYVLLNILRLYFKKYRSESLAISQLIKDMHQFNLLKDEIDIILFTKQFKTYFQTFNLPIWGKIGFIERLYKLFSLQGHCKQHLLSYHTQNNRHFAHGDYTRLKTDMIELYFRNETVTSEKYVINKWA